MLRALTLIALAVPYRAAAEECADYALFRQGTSQTVTSYDARGKEVGSTTSTTTAASPLPSGVRAEVHAESVDHKGRATGAMDYVVTCEAGQVTVDMKAFLPSDQANPQDGWTMSIEGTSLAYPSPLTAGRVLPDGDVVATMRLQGAAPGMPAGMTSTRVEVHIGDRHVEGAEEIITPAGTFQAFKVSFQTRVAIVGMLSMRTDMTGTEWYVPGVGAVRSESFEDGKSRGWSQLTAMTTR